VAATAGGLGAAYVAPARRELEIPAGRAASGEGGPADTDKDKDTAKRPE
jgi:hypothetical protein